MKLDLGPASPPRLAALYAAGALGPLAAVVLLATIPSARPSAVVLHVASAVLALTLGLVALVEAQRLALVERARGRRAVVGTPPSSVRSATSIAVATIAAGLLVSAAFEAAAIATSGSSLPEGTAGERALADAIRRRQGQDAAPETSEADASRPSSVLGPGHAAGPQEANGPSQIGDLLSGAEVLRVRPLGVAKALLGVEDVHLRGFVIDGYDRSGRFRERSSAPEHLTDGGADDVDRARDGWLTVDDGPDLRCREIELELDFVAEPNGIVFAPARLRAFTATEARFRSAQTSWTIDGAERQTYRVRSSLPAVQARALRGAPARGSRSAEWTELPPAQANSRRAAALERMRSYGQLLTRGAESDLDRVLGIVQFLRDEFTYEIYDASFLRPEDFGGFVDRGAGSCTHFASVAALLLRLQSIPTRVVAGYIARDVDPDADEWIVRARDGHAWIEVHFEGYGWLPFDATPGDPAIGGALSNWTPLDDEGLGLGRSLKAPDARTATAGRVVVDALEALTGWLGGTLPLVVLVAALSALVAALRRLGSSRPGAGSGELADHVEAGPELGPPPESIATLLGALRARGWRQGRTTTPTQFARATESMHGEASGLAQAMRPILRRACTGAEPDEREAGQIRRVGERLAAPETTPLVERDEGI